MKPNLEMIESNVNHSFHVNHLKVERFPSMRHYHPEVEILLLVRGTGTRYVGSSVEPYGPGDIVMIGPNVPHEWSSDDNYDRTFSEAIYILFNPDILGEEFWNLPESKIILKIIQKSQRGIKLKGKTRDEVERLLRLIDASYGFNRIVLLLSILELIAFNQEFQYLASPVLDDTVVDPGAKKFNKAYKYIIDNLHHQISLNEAASIASLSTAAFCRYFKKRTNKTFGNFVNEMRIGHACRLLVNEHYSVSEIGYISGFNNISYFIRKFKKVTGYTPLTYRKKFEN